MPDEKVEKRLHPRLKRNLPIEIFDTTGFKVIETKDISASGLYCKVDKDIPLMTRVGITLMLPFFENEKKAEKKVELKGVVVRSCPDTSLDQQSCFEVAVFFDEISEKNRELITKFVENSLKTN